MARDDLIRQRAYELWEREGRPEGRGQAHWEQACREVALADQGGAHSTEGRVPRDPDTGEGLAADPTGWEGREPAAGKGGTGVIVAAAPGEGTAAGWAPAARRKGRKSQD